MDASVGDKPMSKRKSRGDLPNVSARQAQAVPHPHSKASKIFKVLLVTSPKGGVSKTSTARNIAVAAAQDGLRVATIDLDPQGTLTRWWGKRPEEGVAAIQHHASSIGDATGAMKEVADVDLLIIDTPTSVEEYMDEMKHLILSADFILVPVGHTGDDIDSVSPWMGVCRQLGGRAAYLLAKVNRRANSFLAAKHELVETGDLCPIEIPTYEDVHVLGRKGLGVAEVAGAKGSAEYIGVWRYLRNQMEI
jgi:chromosome partitioning protein